jgi:hypothetical protein
VKNTYEAEMDEALKADPPVILWRTNRKGIQVAVKIRDPHTTREKSWV